MVLGAVVPPPALQLHDVLASCCAVGRSTWQRELLFCISCRQACKKRSKE